MDEFNALSLKFGEPMSDQEMEKLMEKQAKLQDKIDAVDGWNLDRHLEIAMTLATGPELLLLDEPTSGMSAVETGRTMTLIGEIARRVTVLIIEHDMDLVMGLSHRVAVMAFGKKIAEGSPAEVARDPEVRRVYLGDL